eukprot:2796957-Rhodomonas_salina.1
MRPRAVSPHPQRRDARSLRMLLRELLAAHSERRMKDECKWPEGTGRAEAATGAARGSGSRALATEAHALKQTRALETRRRGNTHSQV